MNKFRVDHYSNLYTRRTLLITGDISIEINTDTEELKDLIRQCILSFTNEDEVDIVHELYLEAKNRHDWPAEEETPNEVPQ